MTEERFILKFFFDPGSSVCFWSENERARAYFGNYLVDTDKLPLSENLRRKLLHLISWYDTSIDWNYPPNPSPWTEEECVRFNNEVAATLSLICDELGDEYEIISKFSCVEAG